VSIPGLSAPSRALPLPLLQCYAAWCMVIRSTTSTHTTLIDQSPLNSVRCATCIAIACTSAAIAWLARCTQVGRVKGCAAPIQLPDVIHLGSDGGAAWALDLAAVVVPAQDVPPHRPPPWRGVDGPRHQAPLLERPPSNEAPLIVRCPRGEAHHHRWPGYPARPWSGRWPCTLSTGAAGRAYRNAGNA
jgi:hypothetical protein